MIAVRFPASIEERLNELAAKTGRTKTFYVREAVLEHLDDLEDLYLAERRLARNKTAIPLEEVMKQYGLAD
ncbi:type II toxin-antitoxin system RelB family antitoxin [Granulicella paludicola]|uniref:type II toxin-antitoxin system RelB family antitoxin n=1 Tax=Granulicella paludicola TaxID=474951 RepID=UPI0021DF4BF3|nr:DUF6290 family protein [Granulicella paludicola]